MNTREYLNTPKGMLSRYRYRRLYRRLMLSVNGIEPSSKRAMKDEDKLALQSELLFELERCNRRAFRGPLALELHLTTGSEHPSHVQNIVKNLLDLLGRPLPTLKTTRRGLVYFDDSQVHGLSVSCWHQLREPRIFLTAAPMRDFVDDLNLADHARRQLGERDLDLSWDDDNDDVEELVRLLRAEREWTELFGSDAYLSMLRYTRSRAQEKVLGCGSWSMWELAALLGGWSSVSSATSGVERWIVQNAESQVAKVPMRIHLDELPQQPGSSKTYRRAAEEAVQEFQERYSWILKPLLIPVAVEVLVKPPPPQRTRGLHDLDNVVNAYVIPQVVEILSPPTSVAWTFDLDAVEQTMPELHKRWSEYQKTMPRKTMVGLTCFDVWRLPHWVSDGSNGFVSVAVVRDDSGADGRFSRIDDVIDRWAEAIGEG
jgi:hypothetical protein